MNRAHVRWCQSGIIWAETDAMADERKPSLSYERPSGGISRWQFRLLCALLVLNLVVTVQSAYAPQLGKQVKQRWAAWQARRGAHAVNRVAFAFVEPADKVVWEEDPDAAARLLAGGGYRAVKVEGLGNRPFLARWPRSAAATVPPAVDAFHRQHFRHPFPNVAGVQRIEPDETACVLLHRLRTPAGEDRVVMVFVWGSTDLRNLQIPGSAGSGGPGDEWTMPVPKSLRIDALSCLIGADGAVTHQRGDSAVLLIHSRSDLASRPTFTWTPPAGDQPERIKLAGAGVSRFYAGQPDPADASHFTIPYVVDGVPGTIHGRLRGDGSLTLEPTTGRAVGSMWYFDRSSTSPTTKPRE